MKLTTPVKSLLCLLALLCPAAWAQQVPVQEYVLENGLKLLMVPRRGDPNIAAGWIAKVGSVNEHPGITGISHLFEHYDVQGDPHNWNDRYQEGLGDHPTNGRRQGKDSGRGAGSDLTASFG